MKKTASYAIIAGAALAAGFAALAYAAIPQQINYQSRLRTSGGVPVTAATSISFSLYSAASGGTALWTEARNQSSGSCAKVTPDADGYFSVQLGSCNAFPGSLAFDTSLFLGVTVGSDAEATPRVAFSPSPYALNASRVGSVVVSGAADTVTARNIMPDGDNLYDIGTHVNRFKVGYFKDVVFGNTVRLGSENNTDFAKFTLPKFFISASSTVDAADLVRVVLFEKVGTTFLEDAVFEKLLTVQDRQIKFGSNTLTFPAAMPSSNGQVLSGTTAGTLSWIDASSGGGDIRRIIPPEYIQRVRQSDYLGRNDDGIARIPGREYFLRRSGRIERNAVVPGHCRGRYPRALHLLHSEPRCVEDNERGSRGGARRYGALFIRGQCAHICLGGDDGRADTGRLERRSAYDRGRRADLGVIARLQHRNLRRPRDERGIVQRIR